VIALLVLVGLTFITVTIAVVLFGVL